MYVKNLKIANAWLEKFLQGNLGVRCYIRDTLCLQFVFIIIIINFIIMTLPPWWALIELGWCWEMRKILIFFLGLCWFLLEGSIWTGVWNIMIGGQFLIWLNWTGLMLRKNADFLSQALEQTVGFCLKVQCILEFEISWLGGRTWIQSLGYKLLVSSRTVLYVHNIQFWNKVTFKHYSVNHEWTRRVQSKKS